MQKETYSYITGISRMIMLFVLLSFCLVTNGIAGDCDDTQTQTDMNLCANDFFKRADANLDEVYNALMAKIMPKNQEKLKTARSLWESYRKAQCEFNSSGSDGGSIHPSIIANCYADLTNDYTKILKHQLNCEEGNLSCGGQ